MAGLQLAGARARRGRQPAAAGAGEVPGDLRRQPRRVLHGAHRGPETPAEHRTDGPLPRRADHPRAAGADHRPHPGAGAPALRRLREGRRAPDAGGRHPDRALVGAGRGRRRQAARVLPRLGVPGAHPAGGRSGAPLPVHQRALAQPGGVGAVAGHRRGALRAREGAQQRAAIRASRSPSPTSPFRFRRARSLASWGRTAPARVPRSRCCWGWSGRAAAVPAC